MAEGDLLKKMTASDREELRRKTEERTGHEVLDAHVDKIGLYTRVGSHKWTTIEEGKYLDEQIAGEAEEEVLAIFKTDARYYVVCTPNHGGDKNDPFIFRNQEIYMIEEETEV